MGKRTGAPIMLNLGSGTNILPKFINVDRYCESKATNFKKADLRQLPFPSDYADYVLLDNVLEHLPMADVPIVLYEIRRVLKPSGRCVIAVPDFAAIAEIWLAMEKDAFNPIMYIWISETIYGTQLHEGEYHRCPMSPSFLNYVLGMTGFRHPYKMERHPMGTLVPTTYPGINDAKKSILHRHGMLYVDVTK